MEASHLSPEGMQEGYFEAKILTLISFTSPFFPFFHGPKMGYLLLFVILPSLLWEITSVTLPFMPCERPVLK
jgi:hypothetical protein